jgi:flavin-dependent dehydrogenase
LAGLALSVQLAKQGHSVIVFEKEQYPFHKVCGEYISLESWDFLQGLGLDLKTMNVSMINQVEISAVNGKLLKHKLPLGGFGISRYLLDYTLAEVARSAGVTVEEKTKVNDIVFSGREFIIGTSQHNYKARVMCGTYGKRSNIDVRWKRSFVTTGRNKLNNYIGVKYHVHINFPADTIAMHNFENGYCGLAKVEGNKYCLCYLTTAANLQKCKGDIKELERLVLSQNPFLEKIFTENEMLFEAPVTISQISFDKKTQVENHVLMVGDAAGMITPLCGNGMSMALHGSKLAAAQIHLFLEDHITREVMEEHYGNQWRRQFGRRLKAGRMIQYFFGGKRITNLFITVLKPFPGLINFLIKQTHGKSF